MKSAILFLLVPTFILQCLLGSGVLYWHEKQNANLGETITVFLVLQVLFMGTCSAIYYRLIQQPINILSQAIDHTISSQDLTQPIQEVRLSVLNGLLKKYAMLTKSFDDALINVSASAARLSPMAQELGDTNMGIHQRNIVQQNHNKNIADTLQNIESSSREMNRAVEKITEVASSSKETLDHSIASVEDSVQSINELAQETAAAESISNQLYDSSSQIGDIINMINSIAEQTNLLALNAAIEAARAGEAGRGFAVVADEVRNLSIKTQESTFQIDEMIKKIQTDANDMMTTMKTSKQGSEQSVAKVNDVKEHFDHIQNQFEEISGATAMISKAVGNNKTLIMEMIDENTQMNEVNEEIVNFTKTSAISDRDLVNLSRHIEGHLQGFLLSQKEFDTP